MYKTPLAIPSGRINLIHIFIGYAQLSRVTLEISGGGGWSPQTFRGFTTGQMTS